MAKAVRRLGVVVAALALGACGSSATHSSGSPPSATASSSSTTTAAGPAPAVDELAAAQHPVASQFPSSSGKSLQQLAKVAGSAASLGAADGTFTPGFGRFAFALTNNQQRFIYAPTAVYIAPTPTSPASGPFLAPADPMTVQPQYRSQQNAAPGGLQAIYSTNVPAPKAQTYDVLSLTKTSKGLIGATGEIAVGKTLADPGRGPAPARNRDRHARDRARKREPADHPRAARVDALGVVQPAARQEANRAASSRRPSCATRGSAGR